MLMLRKHVVIIGGGWAGIKLARDLADVDRSKLRVTLISAEPNFRYSSALYKVATGHNEREAIIPISEITKNINNLDFVLAKVKSIDKSERTITTSSGQKFHYDFAVIALGVITSYMGIPGIEELSYGIKTQHEIQLLRTHLHQELVDQHAPDKNYVIVGGGATGVELSASMVSYIKHIVKKHGIKQKKVNVELVEASPRVLPLGNPTASAKTLKRLKSLGVKVLLNKRVQKETINNLVVSGKSIPTHTVIWTAGVVNNPFFKNNASQFNLNERGRVVVNDHLQVDKHLYVIGDNAATPFSGLALTAVHDAKYVAKDIKKKLNNQKGYRAYKALIPATAVPVGKRWAIFQYEKIVIGGWLGSLIRIFADFVSFCDIIGFRRALSTWVGGYRDVEYCAVCRTRVVKHH